MTDAEFSSLREQVTRLQQQMESRTLAWRKLGLCSNLLAGFLAVMALGFIVTGLWLDAKASPTTHQFVTIMGYVFILVSTPLSLLGQALRTG
jgi:hypothetical protein